MEKDRYNITSYLAEIAACTSREQLQYQIERIGKDQILNADQIHVRIYDCTRDLLNLECKYFHDGNDAILLNLPIFTNLSPLKGITGDFFRQDPPNESNQDIQGHIKFQELLINLNQLEIDNSIKESCSSILESFSRLIVERLILDNKPIGTIAAIRKTRTSTATTAPDFTDDDKTILSNLAANTVLAIRNHWLFGAAKWTYAGGKQDNPNKTFEALCREVVLEARKRTLADDGKVRFIDWRNQTLVPGTIEKPTVKGALQVPENDHENRERFCSLREKGICAAGIAANDGVARIYNDLETDPAFDSLKKYLVRTVIFYKIQLDHLEKWKDAIESYNNINLDDVPMSLSENIPAHESLKNITIGSEEHNKLKTQLGEDLERRKASIIRAGNSRKSNIASQIAFVKKVYSAMNNYASSVIEWKSEIVAPIKLGPNKIIGVINLHSNRRNFFTQSDLSILCALSDRIALQVMDRQQEIFDKINAIGQEMTTGNFNALAPEIRKGIINAFFSSDTKIYPLIYQCTKPDKPDSLLNTSGELKPNIFVPSRQFNPLRDTGHTTKYLETYSELLSVSISPDGLGREAINQVKKGEVFFNVRQYADDPAQKGSDKVLEHKVKTSACIPLIFRHNVYGLLYIHVTETHYFTDFEKRALILFANQVAKALKNIQSSGGLYKEDYGDRLFRECIERPNVSGSDLIDKITDALRDRSDTLSESYRDDAIECIKDIVTTIFEVASLPKGLSDAYTEFIKQEDFLYHSPAYRDHFFHPFHTFLSGLIILKNNPFITITDDFIRQWIVAAFWHDTSYASAKGPEWLRDFIEKHTKIQIKTSQDWSPMLHNDKVLNSVAQLVSIFEMNYKASEGGKINFTRWLNKQLLEHQDHGVLSAILLLMEPNNENTIRNIEQSALAIALHNYHKSYSFDKKQKLNENMETPALAIGKLPIADFYLAFLLSLCDTAQEWGRPTRKGFNDKVKYKFADLLINQDRSITIKLAVEIEPDVDDSETEIRKLRDKKEDFFNSWIMNDTSYDIIHDTTTRQFI